MSGKLSSDRDSFRFGSLCSVLEFLRVEVAGTRLNTKVCLLTQVRVHFSSDSLPLLFSHHPPPSLYRNSIMRCRFLQSESPVTTDRSTLTGSIAFFFEFIGLRIPTWCQHARTHVPSISQSGNTLEGRNDSKTPRHCPKAFFLRN